MTVKAKKLRKDPTTEVSMSLVEFKAWLKGVEEMQGPGWSPSLEQWVLIRNRLQSVMDSQPSQPTQSQNNQLVHQPAQASYSDLVPVDQFYQPYQSPSFAPENPADVITRALSADPNSKTSPFV